MNWVGERFTDETPESSLYFNLEQELSLRVNDTTDIEQRLAYSPRPDDLVFVDPETGKARSRNDLNRLQRRTVWRS